MTLNTSEEEEQEHEQDTSSIPCCNKGNQYHENKTQKTLKYNSTRMDEIMYVALQRIYMYVSDNKDEECTSYLRRQQKVGSYQARWYAQQNIQNNTVRNLVRLDTRASKGAGQCQSLRVEYETQNAR